MSRVKKMSVPLPWLIASVTVFWGCAAAQPDLAPARALVDAQQLEKAIQSLDDTLRQHPQSAEAYALRGEAALGLNRVSQAIADFEQAQAITGRPDIQSLLAKAYLANGDFAAAESAASQLADKSPSVLILRGRARLAQAKATSAEEDFAEALRLDAKNPEALLYLGAALVESRQFAAAETRLTELIALQPSYPRAYLFRALAREKLGRTEAAEADRNTAEELDPSLRFARSAVAESLLRSAVNEQVDLRPLESQRGGSSP